MARFKMHPFISTMANMLIIFGLVTYATKGVSFGAIDPAIPNIFIPQIGSFPTIILWASCSSCHCMVYLEQNNFWQKSVCGRWKPGSGSSIRYLCI